MSGDEQTLIEFGQAWKRAVQEYMKAVEDAVSMATAAWAPAPERVVPEPAVKPGTAGTATVRGEESVRVMRVIDARNPDGVAWASAIWIDGWLMHDSAVVTDFVPDEDAKALRAELDRAYADKDMWINRHNARVAWAVHEKDEMTAGIEKVARERDEARAEVERLSTAANAAKARALRAERDARAERAEVERLRAQIGRLTEERAAECIGNAFQTRATDATVRDAARRVVAMVQAPPRLTAQDAHGGAQDGPEDAPAGDGGVEGATGAPEGVQTELAKVLMPLAVALMPYAVTEERLAEALERTFDYRRLQAVSTFEADASALLAHLRKQASRG